MYALFEFLQIIVVGVVIVVVVAAVRSIILRSKSNANTKQSEEILRDMALRMEKIEDRMANIETIVLEKERFRKFSNL